MNKDFSFGSQMKLDLHAVETIVDAIFIAMKEGNKEKSDVQITVKKKINNKIVTMFQIQHVPSDKLDNLKKHLPQIIFLLVNGAKPNTIFTKYAYHNKK